MSKSDPDAGSCIYINDPAEVLREKVKKSVTDSIREVNYDPVNRPGMSNVLCRNRE
jgi:tryptophanyl-tRNA synthetase